jgi:chaperone BCS1
MSGLLNAIDGVASQEGRVLVMTTNHPEKLDDALVRPGRIDMKIKFTLANKQQTRELFMRMYCEDPQDLMRQPLKLSEILPVTAGGDGGQPVEERIGKNHPKSNGTNKALYTNDHVANGYIEKPRLAEPTPPMTPTQQVISLSSVNAASSIEELATAFADALPEAVFSPAEIQGFLLTQKKDPLKAVLEVGAWRDGERQKKQPNKTEKETRAETEPNGDEKQDRKEVATADLKANDSTLKAEEKPVFPETGSKALIGTAEGESGSESASSAKSGASGVSGGSVEDSGSE